MGGEEEGDREGVRPPCMLYIYRLQSGARGWLKIIESDHPL